MRNSHFVTAIALCAASACLMGQMEPAPDAAATSPATQAATEPASQPSTEPASQPASQPAVQYGKPVTTDINPGTMTTYKSGGRDIPAYMVTPKLAAGVTTMASVIVVSDIFGMTDFIKAQADAIARQGYTVIVPNLFSRRPNTDKALDAQQAYLAYENTSDAQIHDDLTGAVESLQQDGKPTANQPLAIVGYDMGGTYAMMMAGSDLRVSAAVNYYGRILYATTSPNRPMSPIEDLFNLHAPLLNFYGQNDPQVPDDQIRQLDSRLAHTPNQVFYEIVRYPGVGHGFLVPTRQGYNATAAQQAAERTRNFLAQYLRPEPKKSDE